MNGNDLITRREVENVLLEKGQKSRRYKLGEIWELNFDEIREALSEYKPEIDGAIELIRDKQSQIKIMKEQGYAKIKEPDCRICDQSHCKYYHESQKPAECKSYIRMERL